MYDATEMLWQKLEVSGSSAGFPQQPSALATVDVNGNEVLTVIGGAPSADQSSLATSGELSELCVGRGALTPTDLWARPLRSATLDRDSRTPTSQPLSPDRRRGGSKHSSPEKKRPALDITDEAEPFHRTVLAFPPRPRTGYTLTALDSSRTSYLMFGGHTGQSGNQGHCLADVHLLEYLRPQEKARELSDCSSGSESEEIFFASDYNVVLKERNNRSAKPAPALAELMRGSCRKGGSSSSSSRSSLSEQEDDSVRDAKAEAFEKTLRQTVMNLGSNTKVKMSRKKTASPTKRGSAPAQSPIAESGARWRLPQHQEGVLPTARAGHVAVFEPPSRKNMFPSIVIHGGLDDGGLPLADTYEARICLTDDQPLRLEWQCLDQGFSGTSTSLDGPAPWEKEQAPRPRTCHSGVFWNSGAQRGMVIFGGLGLDPDGEPRPLGDTWVFLRPGAEGTKGGAWKRPIMHGGAPARRWGHGCCLVETSKSTAFMLVCGGIDAAGKAVSDCWTLSLDDMRWELVETLAASSPVKRPLSFMSPSEDVQPADGCKPELGRCTAVWSFSLNAAVVWCGQGFYTCRLVDQQPRSVSPQRSRIPAGDKKQRELAAGYAQRAPWEQHKERLDLNDAVLLRESKASGYVNRGALQHIAFAPTSNLMAPPSPAAFAGLPEVAPPRNARWNAPGSRELCAPSLSRVHSDPKMHDSWRPALVRGSSSQSSLLEPKGMVHGQILTDAPLSWHAKHGPGRLEALAPRDSATQLA